MSDPISIVRSLGLNDQLVSQMLYPEGQKTKLPKVGAKNLMPYIIAVKPLGTARWIEGTPGVIKSSRILHDQGVVTMFQGGDQGYTIQYAKPNNKVFARRAYFTAEEIE